MPSPFPGMDPYLEHPIIWPVFHDTATTEIRNVLNQRLPEPYYARVESRPELGIVEDGRDERRAIVPDVLVLRRPRRPGADETAAVAVAEPRRDVSTWVEFEIPGEPIRHHFVEIRDAKDNHKLITLIEILSPSNKRPGDDRDSYHRKQRDVLDSEANLIEIDLHRSGDRILPNRHLAASVSKIEPKPDYLVLVSRAWRRRDPTEGYIAFPIGLRDLLPCFPVPLKFDEPEPPLDLQYVFQLAYDGGPYRRGAVDYAKPPWPPLADPDAPWATRLLTPPSR